MRADEAEAVDDLCLDVLYHVHPAESETARRARTLARLRHICETDPGGAWVAEDDGRVAGVAMALVRERIWGLSLFAVAGALQGKGVGRRLLDASLRHGDGARGFVILSSPHPAAIRRYARAGLDLHPSVGAAGVADRSRVPDAAARVEDAGEAGIPLADAIGREVRGAGHGRDLPVMLAHGARLLAFEDRAFAVVADVGVVPLLAARDDDAAATVLWGAIAHCPPGATMTVGALTTRQQWAVRTCVEAGLELSPDGPVFLAGELGPFAPYVPSGPFL
jgi:GNAT superfamily N-acetyltransferase